MAWTEIHRNDGTSTWLNPEETRSRNARDAEINKTAWFLAPYIFLIWIPINTLFHKIISFVDPSFIDKLFLKYFWLTFELPRTFFIRNFDMPIMLYMLIILSFLFYDSFFLFRWFTKLLYFGILTPWLVWGLYTLVLG